ncbi:MAG: hypothetical protein RQ761_04305 [Bacteroidales bacterium]|nr:hypothetical protein [Bacteroidales bacterium]
MDYNRKKKSMPVGLAIILIVLVAFVGGLAFYLQYDNNKQLKATAEQNMIDQQNQVLAIFNQIEANLASIREHESMIQNDFSGPEQSGNLAPEERIQNEINFIEHLIAQNNNLIASLNNKLDEKNARLEGYEQTVNALKTRVGEYQNQLDKLVAEKEALIEDLDKTVVERDDLAVQVNVLGEDVEEKSSIIEQQNQLLLEKDKAFHTAYYALGTYKTLRDSSVLQKEGGFLGINRVTTLAEAPDNSQFEEIDTRQISRIPIYAKRFDIVNERDPSSYEVEYANDRAEWLTITDPEKFWKQSRYLVIVVRDNEIEELAESR